MYYMLILLNTFKYFYIIYLFYSFNVIIHFMVLNNFVPFILFNTYHIIIRLKFINSNIIIYNIYNFKYLKCQYIIFHIIQIK